MRGLRVVANAPATQLREIDEGVPAAAEGKDLVWEVAVKAKPATPDICDAATLTMTRIIHPELPTDVAAQSQNARVPGILLVDMQLCGVVFVHLDGCEVKAWQLLLSKITEKAA